MRQQTEMALASFPEPLFDWRPDAERLSREVRSAELKGRRDDLTLAEIECSMDLIDAELAGRRRHGGEIDAKTRELTTIRAQLDVLARRLYRLPE